MSSEAFLSRWSRLKRKAAETKTAEEGGRDDGSFPDIRPPLPEEGSADSVSLPREAGEGGDPAADTSGPADPLADLPPVEELTAESDFTPFLRAGVPEDLHRQALRKLWTSDPVFANDDGLKDYAEDYTGLFTGSDPVKTLYRVGKGFLDAVEEAEDHAGPIPDSLNRNGRFDAEAGKASEDDMTEPA